MRQVLPGPTREPFQFVLEQKLYRSLPARRRSFPLHSLVSWQLSPYLSIHDEKKRFGSLAIGFMEIQPVTGNFSRNRQSAARSGLAGRNYGNNRSCGG